MSYSDGAEVQHGRPVVARDHYCIPPLERLNLQLLLELIEDKRYFVLHAPRQTGKTSTLLALRDLLDSGAEGNFRCVYVNVEAAQALREDVRRAIRVILGELASRARSAGDEFLYGAWPDIAATFGEGALAEALTRWCENNAAPVVLLIDEIDTLIGDTLIAVLRQLRARYDRRPEGFPQSVVLCGVRDVRDYRIQSSAENTAIAGGSAFNVRAESLRLGDFTEAGGARAAGPAHPGDGPIVHPGGPGDGLAADPWAAVAGERSLPPRLLRRRAGPRPIQSHCRR